MPAASALPVIRARRDFLAAARGSKWIAPTLILQMCRRPADHPAAPAARIGYTVSKKVGNAVVRNRAKRRLREAARQIAPAYMQQSCDYVVIARHTITGADFSTILRDMEFAFSRIHAKKKPSEKTGKA